jgi:hypothetical protein
MSNRQNPYAAIIAAFPAGVVVTRSRDRLGTVVAFRIAGPKVSVAAELGRMVALCNGRAWLRIMGPVKWHEEYVAFGEIREQLDLNRIWEGHNDRT